MAEQPEEVLLPGFVDRVVRVGETVRRPREPWSAATEALLLDYEPVRFDLGPRHHGYDDEDRHVVSFVPGDTINERHVDPAVLGAAVRGLHDAGVGLQLPPGAHWQNGRRELVPGELIAHNDLGPWNIIGTTSEITGVIDFDTAGPCPPVGEHADLAYRRHW